MLRVDGPDQATIVRLRIASSGVEPSLAQLRVAGLLSAAQLHPAGLPSSAVIIVRNFRDPKPGLLRLDRSGGSLPAAWNQAANESLGRIASSAARPAREMVPASAEAVVFIDRSELLACLASDWCEGSVMSRWWWQSLLKQGAATQIVKELWRRDPRYVPAALQLLAGKNKATDFVRALSDAEAHQLSRGVAQSFSLAPLVRLVDDFERSASAGVDSFALNHSETVARQPGDHLTATPPGPWRPWVPECRAAGLRPEQEFFFGIALMLQRAPVKARAPEFHASVREWVSLASAGKTLSGSARGQAATAGRKTRDSANLAEPSLDPADQPQRARAVAQVAETSGSRTQVNDADNTHNAHEATGEANSATSSSGRESIDVSGDQMDGQVTNAPRPDAGVRSRLTADSAPRAAAGKLRPATITETRGSDSPVERGIVSQPAFHSTETFPTAGESPSAGDDNSPLASIAPLPSPDDETQAEWSAFAESEQVGEWIETGLGGAFYLINLGLALGFYGDFTTPDEPGIELSVWDFVALLAHRLVGDEVTDDPVWPLLRRLAGAQEGELLGSGFEEAVLSFDFSVLSFGPGEASEARPETLSSEVKTQNSKLKTPPTHPAVAAWLDRLLPYVRARLRQALGLSDRGDPGPLVCRQRARVYLTPTHLDVFFFLAELPIEIRIAGLDRNPGWVPAAGKFIAFHFD